MFCKTRSDSESTGENSVYRATRLMAILQLCLAFTVIAWNLSYPFMGELFSFKAKMLVYQDVMGMAKNSSNHEESTKTRLRINAERFAQLPEEQKERILSDYTVLQKQSEKSFWERLRLSFQILVFELPAWEQAWIFFSIAICVLLLLGVEGVIPTIWLLPLITLCYVWSNQSIGIQTLNHAEYALYPKEEVLIRSYLKRPLSKSVFTQQEELREAWQNYLISMWAKEQPSKVTEIRRTQLEKGEFYFHLKRLDLMDHDQQHQLSFFFNKKHSFVILAIYFCWNLFFALRVSWLAIKDSDSCPVGSWAKVRES